MRIGLVDLDTSHPKAWIPIERELGHEVAGVWDGGSVHPAGYAQTFAEEMSIPQVFDSLEAMADAVDCAIIHGCDWDTHVDKARPFVAAGKAVLVDKPLAGNLRDLEQLVAWANDGARITGGSALRFCVETREWLSAPVDERGTAQTAICGCGVDPFNYGIHAYSMLSGVMGSGAKNARDLGGGPQHHVQANWADGRLGIVVTGEAGAWLPFYATVVTEKSVAQYTAAAGKLYRALLEATLPYLAGETDEPPVPMAELIEPELCALAALRSRREGGREVALDELTSDDPGYDGAAFAEGYRLAKYPPKSG